MPLDRDGGKPFGEFETARIGVVQDEVEGPEVVEPEQVAQQLAG